MQNLLNINTIISERPVTLEYVQSLSDVICDPDTELAEKRKAYREMDKVLRIAKQYSDRVLLAEGKTTANIGIDGKGGLPFKVIFTETFEGLPPEGSEPRRKAGTQAADVIVKPEGANEQ